MRYRNLSGGIVGTICVLAMASAGYADGIHVTDPVDGATVREVVPIHIAKTDLPQNGYVSIAVDGALRTARVLPSEGDTVYLWDTKTSAATTGISTDHTYTPDGDHTLAISVYSVAGDKTTLVGSQTVKVKVENQITMPASQPGVILKYKFKLDDTYKYSRKTELGVTVGDAPDPSVSKSELNFSRSVEDVAGDEVLLRDRVLPKGFVQENGMVQPLDTAFNIKSKYRSVNFRGNFISDMKPLTEGDHFGFSVPSLPDRRVAVGDAWQAPVTISLKWSGTEPATIPTVEAKLEGFEWQDRYPCARIRETYSGPVTFPAKASAMSAYSSTSMTAYGRGGSGQVLGSATPAAPVTSVTIDNVKFERVVFFAYNSGRLIKTITSVSIDGMKADQYGSLDLNVQSSGPAVGSSSSAYAGMMGDRSGQSTSSAGPVGPSAATSDRTMRPPASMVASGSISQYMSSAYGDNGDNTSDYAPTSADTPAAGIAAPDTTVKLTFAEITEVAH